jgi:uncharacterized membrane protein
LAASASAATGPTVTILGAGTAQAISNDGSIISGNNGTTIWTWTADAGLVAVPATLGRSAVISPDGTVLAGVSTDANGNQIQCYQPHPAAAPWQFLPPVGNGSCTDSTLGWQVCVSGDGGVIGGALPRGGCSGNDVAVTYTESGGLIEWYSPFGSSTRITAMSDDGTTYIGTHYATIAGASTNHGCIWYADGSFEPLSSVDFHGALGAVNRDGSMVAGNAHPQTGNVYTWTAAGGFHDMGELRGIPFALIVRTADMTDDGSVVIGTAGDSFSSQAAIWRDGLGGEGLKDYLLGLGATGIGDYYFQTAAAITPDGRYIVGALRTPTSGFNNLAYVIDLIGESDFCPADFNQDGGVDGADVEAFYAAWENSEPDADVNQDGGVDGGDVETFFAAWEAGGCQ